MFKLYLTSICSRKSLRVRKVSLPKFSRGDIKDEPIQTRKFALARNLKKLISYTFFGVFQICKKPGCILLIMAIKNIL